MFRLVVPFVLAYVATLIVKFVEIEVLWLIRGHALSSTVLLFAKSLDQVHHEILGDVTLHELKCLLFGILSDGEPRCSILHHLFRARALQDCSCRASDRDPVRLHRARARIASESA